MAKFTGPILKKCRALGMDPIEVGVNKKSTRGASQGFKKKQSEYAMQLKEKQKAKFIYGILEKQFRNYYAKAERMRGITGENMLILLERRLDNVIYRLGMANTRPQARQLVTHGHFVVNGKNVNIASYSINVGDVITVKDNKKNNKYFEALRGLQKIGTMPKWLDFDTETLTGKILALPTREEIDSQIAEHMIVELYSK